jgi:hypothetical protein
MKNKSIFFPLRQTQDPTLRASKENDAFSVYDMQGFSQNNSSLDDDYIVETEHGTEECPKLFLDDGVSYRILASLSLFNKVFFVGKIHIDNGNIDDTFDFCCVSDLTQKNESYSVSSFIYGYFSFPEDNNISLCLCDDNGCTKVFIADGINPLRVVTLNKSTFDIEGDNYIVLSPNEDYSCDVTIKSKKFTQFSGLTTGNQIADIGNRSLITAHDALDVLSVSYDFDRNVTVTPTETSSASFKIGNYSIGLYEGIRNHPRSACVYDSEVIYLTSQNNKANDTSSQSIVVNIKKAYPFSKDYMSVVVKNHTTGEYKESELFFLGRLPISAGNSFTAYTKNTIQIIMGMKNMSTATVVLHTLYATEATTLILDKRTITDFDNDVTVTLNYNDDCYVYTCFVTIDNVRYDIPTSFDVSFTMTNTERLVQEDRILERERTGIVPTHVSVNKGRLLCCTKNDLIVDQNGLNEMIGLIGSSSSAVANEPDDVNDFINQNPESITKNSVALPYTTYMFGYQFKNKYGVWTDILVGDSSSNLDKYRIPIALYADNMTLSTNAYAYYYKGTFFLATRDTSWTLRLTKSNERVLLSSAEVDTMFGIAVTIDGKRLSVKDYVSVSAYYYPTMTVTGLPNNPTITIVDGNIGINFN